MGTAPLSPYALQKLVAEQYCQMFTRLYGLETVTIRYFNVFGPRQDPSSPYSGVISLFIRALVEGCKAKGHEVAIGGELYSDALGKEDTPEGTYAGMIRHNVKTIVNALK